MFESCGGCCLALVLIPLLCCGALVLGVYYVNTNGPDAPLSDNFRASPAEAQALDNEIARATNDARSMRWFALSFTERQLSSWIALEGQDFAEAQGHNMPFENMQVGLDDGQMTFYGEIKQVGLTLPLAVVIEPKADSENQIELDIVSADVGGLKVPAFVLENVQAQLTDRLIKPFDDLPGTYFIYPDSLSIQDGVFVVQGGVNLN